MWHPFLEYGGILFWGIMALVGLIIVAQIHTEKILSASATLVLLILGLVFFTTMPLVHEALAHPMYILYGVLAYLGIAGIWSIAKWRLFFLPKLFDRYEDLRSQFLTNRKLNIMPADPKVTNEFESLHAVRLLDIKTTRMASYNKARITTWMIFWSFSMVETFFGDLLQQVVQTLYKAIVGLLQRMSDGMASQYSELN